jgi:hypothetical protein
MEYTGRMRTTPPLAARQTAADRRFFLYVPFHVVHDPNEVGPSHGRYGHFRILPLHLRFVLYEKSLMQCSWAHANDLTAHGQVPTEFLAKYPTVAPAASVTARVCGPQPWSKCRTVLAMTAVLDAGIGEIVGALREAGNGLGPPTRGG